VTSLKDKKILTKLQLLPCPAENIEPVGKAQDRSIPDINQNQTMILLQIWYR